MKTSSKVKNSISVDITRYTSSENGFSMKRVDFPGYSQTVVNKLDRFLIGLLERYLKYRMHIKVPNNDKIKEYFKRFNEASIKNIKIDISEDFENIDSKINIIK